MGALIHQIIFLSVIVITNLASLLEGRHKFIKVDVNGRLALATFANIFLNFNPLSLFRRKRNF